MITDLELRELRETCEAAARAGAAVLMEWRGKIQVREKAPADLVTQADLASQQQIRQLIWERYPEHNFVGEEQEETAGPTDSPYRWIVDPLDGTTNYVHGLAFYSVSVAVECNGELIAGVVFDPERNECFAASRGMGATCNGQSIQPSATGALDQALLVTGFPPKTRADSPDVVRFGRMMEASRAIRRLGSAALNICYVACGRVDAYWASSVNAWDIAAGVLIAREAGALVTSLDGAPLDIWRPQILTASTDQLHRALVEGLRITS
jgi:myo-inositol-1(or 4)-monophosphatase